MKTEVKRNKGHHVAVLCGIVSLFSLPLAGHAENRWSVEFRPGVNHATSKLGGADLKTGFGFESTVAYRFMPHLAAFAGWSWNQFGADQSFAGPNVDFEETGYIYGLQFVHPIGSLGSKPVDLLVRVAALENHIEVENDKGDTIADSGHGFGWRAEVGLEIPLGQKWSLVPSVRYHELGRDLRIGGVKTSVDLNYLSAGLGVAYRF